MNLHEYQSRSRFADFGIPVLDGRLAYSPDEVYRIAQMLDGKVMLKAQVLVSGRNKAGGIRHAQTAKEARDIAKEMLNAKIKGQVVRKILVDPVFEAEEQIYIGITNDRDVGRPVMVVSPRFSDEVDIEQFAQKNPQAVIRQHIDPFLGLLTHQITAGASGINLSRQHWRPFHDIAKALYECYVASDALSVEINPLIVTDAYGMLASNTRMSIDNNALFRHRDLAQLHDEDADPVGMIHETGIKYVKLHGQVGCVVNGAGLGMATMDMLQRKSAGRVRPAIFLDIGGGAQANKTAAALGVVFEDPDIQAVLINIFGGITRCDEVANGILRAYEKHRPVIPLIVRLQGTSWQSGHHLLTANPIPHLHIAHSMTEAVEMTIHALTPVQQH